MNYYLGIDNGSSSVKAGLYDAKGREIAVGKREVPVCTTQSAVSGARWFERDMEELWRANCAVIRETIEKAGIISQDIRAVACCGHGKGIYFWGEDGPVYPGILSSDTRAQSYIEKWRQDGTEEFLFEKTQQHMLACHPVAMMCWFRDHKPELLPRIRHIFTCKDYIRFRLSGQAAGEITECCGWGVMNAKTFQYDEEILERLHLRMFSKCLPPIFYPTDICGTVSAAAARETGLAEGTAVAGGLFDIGASAIAVNAVDSENICMIAGSWSINEYIRPEPIMDGSVLMNSVFCEPGSYLIEESSPTSAVNFQWYLSNILAGINPKMLEEKRVYDILNRWVEEIPPQEICPVYLPFVAGSNVHPGAKGAFVGLHAAHDHRHMTRSIYEGVTFSHRWHLEKLLANHPTGVREIHLAGGAANSEVWAQMFADVCGYPVRTSDISETGALGCAIVGAVASGAYPNLQTAIREMVHLSDAICPNEDNRAVYDRKYHLYKKTIQVLNELWDEFV